MLVLFLEQKNIWKSKFDIGEFKEIYLTKWIKK